MGTKKLILVPMGTKVPKWGPTWEQCNTKFCHWEFVMKYFVIGGEKDLQVETGPILEYSVPNYSNGLIFVKRRAKDGRFSNKNTGVRRAQRRAKLRFW